MSRFFEEQFGKCSDQRSSLIVVLSELIAWHPKDSAERFERRLMAARDLLAEVAPITLASQLSAASESPETMAPPSR